MSKAYTYKEFQKCPIIYAMELIGSKWKIPILWNLTKEDCLHYNEMKRRIAGITNTMLTRALRDLERDGLILRIADGNIPPSVTYHLTEEGKKLIPSLNGLYEWGEAHQTARISENRG